MSGIAQAALGVEDLAGLLEAELANGKTVEQTVTDKIATIGENMTVRRMARITGDNVVSYTHNAAAPRHGQDRRSGGLSRAGDEGFSPGRSPCMWPP